jgi:hypothetical protein
VLLGALNRLQYSELAPMDMDKYAAQHIDFILRGLKA